MATRKGYWIDGKRVPGVTTITGRFKESGGLIHWAWDLGMQGINYRTARDTAASSGTVAHDMIEAHLLGELDEFEPPEDLDETTIEAAKAGFEMYKKWATQSKLRVIDTEVELLSEKHRFGGRLDAVGFVDGELCILDWKTSGSLYVEALLQTAGGYKILWEENHQDQPITGGVHIVRFSKEHADFEHRHFASGLEEIERTFLLERELYEALKPLVKRVR